MRNLYLSPTYKDIIGCLQKITIKLFLDGQQKKLALLKQYAIKSALISAVSVCSLKITKKLTAHTSEEECGFFV